jgi:hypothetical protein
VLDVLLDKIATYKEKTESIKGKIKKALFYPGRVIVVAIVVTAVIMLFVIPQFKALFSSFGADLPAFTLLVIAISDFMREYWWASCSAARQRRSGRSSTPTSARAKFREVVDRAEPEAAGGRPDPAQGRHRPLRPHPLHHVRRRRAPGGGPGVGRRRHRQRGLRRRRLQMREEVATGSRSSSPCASATSSRTW